MLFSSFATAVALGAVVYASPQITADNNRGGNNPNGLRLLESLVQKGSTVDGSKQIGAAEKGQALSKTSNNNFINFCKDKTLTNGQQVIQGSCNGIVMGEIPAKTAMVSSVILNPQTGGEDLPADETFDIEVQVLNLVPGSFTNAQATYYSAPQALKDGKVVGHTHVTVQDLGDSINPSKPLDPTKFAFFKGINDEGDGKGLLKATVAGGLPAGNYRVCTMTSASNHQPVLMPVAQRGTPDDCTKFTVSKKGNNNNNNNNANTVAASSTAATSTVATESEGAATKSSETEVSGRATATAGRDSTSTESSIAEQTTSAEATNTNSRNGGNGNAASTSAAAAATTTAAGKGRGNGRGRQRPRRVFIE